MIVRGWATLAERVDALQLRERVMLLIAAVALAYLLVDSFGLRPVLEEHRSLLEEIEERELRLGVLRARSNLEYGDLSGDRPPSLDNLRRELQITGERLRTRLDDMLSPDRAASVLERVVTEQEGLVLNALRARQVPLTEGSDEEGARATLGDVDRHELELRLEGSYLATLRYLRALEALPRKVFWTSVTFETVDYPVARVGLDIYTLDRREH